MWLQLVGAPDIVDGGLADALALCHGSATPVRHPRWFGLQSRFYNGSDLVYFVARFPSPARSNVPQTVQPLLAKALSPQNHRIAVHRKMLCNSDIGLALSYGQHDTAAQRHLLRSAVGPNPLLDLLPLHGRKLT